MEAMMKAIQAMTHAILDGMMEQINTAKYKNRFILIIGTDVPTASDAKGVNSVTIIVRNKIKIIRILTPFCNETALIFLKFVHLTLYLKTVREKSMLNYAWSSFFVDSVEFDWCTGNELELYEKKPESNRGCRD
jgi:hypothetical protein